MSKCPPPHPYSIPRGLRGLLEEFSREILRHQPKNIPLFLADYIDRKLAERELPRKGGRNSQADYVDRKLAADRELPRVGGRNSKQSIDSSGRAVNKDGQRLDSSGRPTNKDGQRLDSFGRPINERGQLIDSYGRPINDQGQPIDSYVTGSRSTFQRIDSTGRSTGPNGQFVDPSGRAANKDGQLIDSSGRPINERGQRIDTSGRPINDQGQLIDSFGNPINKDGQRIDSSGRATGQQGQFLDSSGRPINKDGQLIDSFGNPINKDGQRIDSSGRVTGQQGQFIDSSGRPVNKDGQLIDSSGRAINKDGQRIDSLGRPMNDKSQLTDSSGRPVNERGQLLDSYGRPMNERGQLVDSFGNPINKDGQRIDSSGRTTGQQGQFVDSSGRPVNKDGQLIDSSGRAINKDGQRIDSLGRPMNDKSQLTDSSGRPVNERGQLLDSYGRPINDQGQLIDSFGNPINEDGQRIDFSGRATGQLGQFVDSSGRAVNKDGQLIDSSGRAINERGQRIDPSTSKGSSITRNSKGQLIGADGKLLKTNSQGQLVDSDGRTLIVNEHGELVEAGSGRVVMNGQLLGADGKPLKMNRDGQLVDSLGKPMTLNNGQLVEMDWKMQPISQGQGPADLKAIAAADDLISRSQEIFNSLSQATMMMNDNNDGSSINGGESWMSAIGSFMDGHVSTIRQLMNGEISISEARGTIVTLTISFIVGVIMGYAIARSTGLIGGRQTTDFTGLPFSLEDGPDPAAAPETPDPDSEFQDDDDYVEEDEIPSNIQPLITSKPLKIEVDEGQKVELPCLGEHLQHFALIWQKGSNFLAAGEVTTTQDKRFSLKDKASVLVIDKVTPKDSGEYTCKTTGPSDNIVEVTHTLRVFEKPRVTVSEKARVVKENEPVSLSCNATGYPEPIVFWERRGKNMPNGEKRIEGAEVTFSSVSRHHAGVYECYANSSKGDARTAIDLVVKHAPEIEIEKESVNSGQGYDAELVCIVHAEPKANVVWFKDGSPLDYSKHKEIQKQSHHWTLHISNVQEDDFGNYACVANNPLGRVNKSILLSGAPSQPILKESSLGKDHMSYNLVWVLESATPIESYRMKFRKFEGEWEEIEVTGQRTQQHVYTVSHTLGDLSPSSDYEATLVAYNKFGWSKEARPGKFHINGEFQSLEAESGGPSAKGATGSSSIVSASTLAITLALFLTLLQRNLRWQ